MESIDAYLTKEGWRNDLEKTMADCQSLSQATKQGLSPNQRGNLFAGILVAMVATPVCAYVGSYLGEGIGYLWGNLMDVIPLAKDVAPWLAERSGLISDAKHAANLNEDLYQTSGAISGFYGGLFLPWKIIFAASR